MRPAGQLPNQARLARAGLAAQQRHLGLTVPVHPPPQRLQIGQVLLPPEQRHGVAGLTGIGRAQGDGLPHLHRLPLALQDDRLAGAEHGPGADQLRGQGPAQHLARSGGLLEAGRHVDGVADDRAVPALPHGGGHHLPRVDADREDQITTEPSHRQTGRHGALGVVVVGDGDPEHGHEGVAHVLVDGAAVLEHHRPQFPERRVDHAGDDLGVGALREGGEPDHVGEQHRGQLALLEGRGVTRGRRSLDQHRPALPAKALAVGMGCATAGAAHVVQAGPALTTETEPLRAGGATYATRRHDPQATGPAAARLLYYRLTALARLHCRLRPQVRADATTDAAKAA